MINGLFNQALVPFAYLFVKVLAPALLFGSESLTLMFASLMASTATIIVGGIPAAIYERFIGAKDDSTDVSLWIWLAGTGILTLPAVREFLRHQALTPLRLRDCQLSAGLAPGYSRSAGSPIVRTRTAPWNTCAASPMRPCCAPAGSARLRFSA